MDLMRLAKSDRMGLVVFAGSRFSASAPDLDEQAFQQAVDAVSVGIVPVGGTSLSAAIHTTLDAFEKGNDNHKVMVLFTDGEDHDADTETMAAAKEAAEAGCAFSPLASARRKANCCEWPTSRGILRSSRMTTATWSNRT
jgi:Ca-activated chloride channel homolog